MQVLTGLLFSPSLELILLVGALLANAVLAFAVYRSNPHSATNVVFCLLSVFTSLWLVNNYASAHVSQTIQYSELSLIVARFGIFFAAPLSALFFLLGHTLPSERLLLGKHWLYAALGATFVMMVLNLSPYAFTGVTFVNGSLELVPGPGLIPFSIISTLFSGLAVFLLVRKYIRASGVARKQLGLVLLGILAMLSLIILTVLVPLVLYRSLQFLQFTPLYTLIFLGLTAYAITKYQLFSIKVLVTQALTLVLCVTLFAKIFGAESIEAKLIDAVIFALSALFGYLLVQSVHREVRQRELIQVQEKELEAVNKQQESLLHFISHEIKGYLTKSEAAFAAIYGGDYGEVSPKLHDMSGTALADTRKGVETVMSILDASNLKRGTVSFAKQQFDLAKVVADVVQDLEPTAKERGLELQYDAPEGDYVLVGDEEKIRRHVVRNIIDNSIKYTLHGHVRVQLSRQESSYRILVSDTGVGITSEDMKRLFTEGGKGAESIKVNVHSTGYGLYIAKMIVEGHGGKVWAESDGKDKGSRFIIELPGQG